MRADLAVLAILLLPFLGSGCLIQPPHDSNRVVERRSFPLSDCFTQYARESEGLLMTNIGCPVLVTSIPLNETGVQRVPINPTSTGFILNITTGLPDLDDVVVRVVMGNVTGVVKLHGGLMDDDSWGIPAPGISREFFASVCGAEEIEVSIDAVLGISSSRLDLYTTVPNPANEIQLYASSCNGFWSGKPLLPSTLGGATASGVPAVGLLAGQATK